MMDMLLRTYESKNSNGQDVVYGQGLLTGKLNCEQKKQIIKSTDWSVILYAAETWTLAKAGKKLLEAFEMWTWQRVLKMSWTEKVTNEEALVHANEARSILKTIRYRKYRCLGHVLRHDNLLHEIIKGKVLGKATRGRKRMEFLHDMMEGRDCGQLKDLISDTSRWRQDSK